MRLKVEVTVIPRPQLFLKIISTFLKKGIALKSTIRIRILIVERVLQIMR